MRTALAIAALLVVGTACDASTTTVAPTPAPTVTVTATATEVVTEEPTDAPGRDACDDLVGGESLAFVFVTEPAPGTQVSSPFEFAGCSNTFEAAYEWRLLDRDGRILAQGFGNATCGTGCVGTFRQSVTFTVTDRQVGTLQVFTTSAEDGSERDVNALPLVLEP